MLAKETPIEQTKISLFKEQQFPCWQWTGFLSASQQDISHMPKGQDLPCCIAKILLECIEIEGLVGLPAKRNFLCMLCKLHKPYTKMDHPHGITKILVLPRGCLCRWAPNMGYNTWTNINMIRWYLLDTTGYRLWFLLNTIVLWDVINKGKSDCVHKSYKITAACIILHNPL